MSIPRVVITTRCNFNCEYCAGPKQRIPEASVRDWIVLLRKPEYKKIIFTGGEPLLYEGIWELIERLGKPVEIYTNLCAKSITTLHSKITYNISIHGETDFDALSDNIRKLALFGVPHSIHRVKGHGKEIEERLKCDPRSYRGLRVEVAEDQRNLKMNNKSHLCNIRRVLFGPDAKRYPCCARMGEFEVGEGRYDGTYCREPKCLPCDLFAKTHKEDAR